MPHLSPISWILMLTGFWLFFSMIFMNVWWQKPLTYFFPQKKKSGSSIVLPW